MTKTSETQTVEHDHALMYRCGSACPAVIEQAHAESLIENEAWEARQADEQAEVLNGHRHDLVEVAMSDCPSGCKIFRCWCGEQEVRHMASYGCPTGKAEAAAARLEHEPIDLIEVQELLPGELPEDYCPSCGLALLLHPGGRTCDGDKPEVDRRVNLH